MQSSLSIYHIAGNVWGRKLSRISKKWLFRGENFHRMLKPIICKLVRHTRISWRKLLQVATKPKNLWMFSPSKVLCYMYMVSSNFAAIGSHCSCNRSRGHGGHKVSPICLNTHMYLTTKLEYYFSPGPGYVLKLGQCTYGIWEWDCKLRQDCT